MPTSLDASKGSSESTSQSEKKYKFVKKYKFRTKHRRRTMDSTATNPQFRFKYRRPPLPPQGYTKIEGSTPTTILYCGGFMAESEKDVLGQQIEDYCVNNHHSIIRFDYSDVGKSVWKTMAAPGTSPQLSSYSQLFGVSNTDLDCTKLQQQPIAIDNTTINTLSSLTPGDSAELEDDDQAFRQQLKVITSHLDPNNMSFNHWLQDVVGLLEEATGATPQDDDGEGGMSNRKAPSVKRKTKVILIGYDMGAWLALLAAEKRPELVEGVIGVSSCFDFIERNYESELNEEQRKTVTDGGVVSTDLGVYTKRLVDESALLSLGDRKSISLPCPARFVHCLKDRRAPYSDLVKLTERLSCSEDVEIETLGKGEPRDMSGPKGLKVVLEALDQLIQIFDGERKIKADELRAIAVAEEKKRLEEERQKKEKREAHLKEMEIQRQKEERERAKQRNKEEQAKALVKAKVEERPHRRSYNNTAVQNGVDHHSNGTLDSELLRKEQLELVKLQQKYYQMKLDKLAEK